jgi:putative ABC transport system substrate-binding protein
MRRREFIVGLGSAAVMNNALSSPLSAQQALPVIGFLGTGSSSAWTDFAAAFRRGLAESGYEVGRNVGIEFRWADGDNSRLPALAAELANRPVSVIVSSAGIVAARAASSATASIPIVFVMGGDPVNLGMVPSISRPGGNVTGVSFLLNVLAAKRMELLHAVVPAAKTVGLLFNPDNPNAAADTSAAQEAGRRLGKEIHVAHVKSQGEFDAAFTRFTEQRIEALFVGSDVLFMTGRAQLVALAAKHKIPANYDRRELTEAGGLFSYGTNFADAHRQVGIYAARILKGEKPADLPIVQAAKFELVINMKTAKAIGLEIPSSLLFTADEVIE